MYGHLCKFLGDPWKGLPLHSYFHGRSVSGSNFSLGLQLSLPSVCLIAISSCCFLKLQRTVLFRVWAHSSGHALPSTVFSWHRRNPYITHTSLTHLNITRHHIVSLPFLYFCHLCSILLSVQTGSGELSRLSSNTRTEMLVSLSGRHPQILQVVL